MRSAWTTTGEVASHTMPLHDARPCSICLPHVLPLRLGLHALLC